MIKNKAVKIFFSILIVMVISIMFIVPTNAFGTLSDCIMIGGVGQSGTKTRYYWINPDTFDSTWNQRARDAMYDWCHTGTEGCGAYTSVWFGRTTNQHSSVVDFQRNNNLGDNVYGKTTLYRTAGESSPIANPYTDNYNWTWAKCSINFYACNYGVDPKGNSVALTNIRKKAVIEHEIGHAFGLADLIGTNQKDCLMYMNQYLCTATEPSFDECAGINYLYGGYIP